MKRKTVLVTLLFTLTGILVGTKISLTFAEQPVQEYVPPPRAVARPEPALESPPFKDAVFIKDSVLSGGAKPLTPTTPPPQSVDAFSDFGIPLSPPLPGYYHPSVYSVPQQIGSVSPLVGWAGRAQSHDAGFTSSGNNYVMPARFQVALERSKKSDELTVVICDTSTGSCWYRQIGSSEWISMGSPTSHPLPTGQIYHADDPKVGQDADDLEDVRQKLKQLRDEQTRILREYFSKF